MKDINILINELKCEDINNRKIKYNYYMINTILSKQFDLSLKKYLEKNKIKRIIIYGAGSIGKVFFDKLKVIESLTIVAIVDKGYNNNFEFDNKKIKSISDIENMEYDIIIITPILYYENIKEALISKNILSFIPITDIFEE